MTITNFNNIMTGDIIYFDGDRKYPYFLVYKIEKNTPIGDLIQGYQYNLLTKKWRTKRIKIVNYKKIAVC